jgi:hypothetical protein
MLTLLSLLLTATSLEASVKTCHWTKFNVSGLAHVAASCAEAERRLGHEAVLMNIDKPEEWIAGPALDADIHVVHSAFPEIQRHRIKAATGRFPKLVFVSHGIPEHVVELASNALLSDTYAPVDLWMNLRHWLKTADAFVVFTERQQAIYRTMVPRATTIDLVPLGVDLAFWANGTPTTAHLDGSPAVWMSENQHRIKWALDVFEAWPFVLEQHPSAHIHAHYIPLDMHRVLVDLANTNGAAFAATISSRTFDHANLRDFWKGADFMLATTRYGDNTLLTMQAEAASLKTISYTGNQYASYWMPEGDQRVMADVLAKIFRGETEPRSDKLPVPDILDLGRGMVAIYERVLS